MTGARLSVFTDDIWVVDEPASILGMKLTKTMTVMRLSDGGLLLHSPVALSPELGARVDALGTVSHLFAPNLFHHM